MKTLYFFCLLSILSFSGYSQITFEEIEKPYDFSIGYLTKSPSGEYFLQAYRDYENIFTSMDGISWTKTSLPDYCPITTMEFHVSGSALIHSKNRGNYIRRPNNSWNKLSLSGNIESVDASCIKDDTLFVFQNDKFAISTNYGAQYDVLFTVNDPFSTHDGNLFRYKNYLILHHTIGARDFLKVYTDSGDLVFSEEINISVNSVTFNKCGQLLFLGNWEYYLLRIESLRSQNGPISEFFPFVQALATQERVFSYDNNYYIKNQDKIYVSDGCNFNWSIAWTDSLFIDYQNCQVLEGDNILLFDQLAPPNKRKFLEKLNSSSIWEEKIIQFNKPHVLSTNESVENQQYCLTPNNIFTKSTLENSWARLDSTANSIDNIAYSPSGYLYINQGTHLLYSDDNGSSFSLLNLPPNLFFTPYYYQMKVLEDGVIILSEGFPQCYLTTNNGQSWIPFVTNASNFELPYLKLIGNYIYCMDAEFTIDAFKIDIHTGEVITYSQNILNLTYPGRTPVVTNDGTYYIYIDDITRTLPEGLYRCRFGEDIEFVTTLPSGTNLDKMVAVKDDIFLFSQDQYFLLSGNTWQPYDYSGLPTNGNFDFFVSSNYHVYVVIDNERIFRSNESIGFDQFLTGKVVFDINEDCNEDGNETGLKNWQVKAENGNFLKMINTREDGTFRISVPPGNYSLTCEPVTTSWELCEDNYQIVIDQNQANVNQDFLAKAVENCANLSLDFSTPFLRRCFANFYTVTVSNSGPLAATNSKLTLKLDPFYDFISATIPYVQIDAHTYEFDFGTLELDQTITFRLNFQLSCDADLGMEHCLEGSLEADNLCENPTILESVDYIECQENLGAFDPNDKRIFNKNGKEVSQVDLDEYIYYHIRFQNTGTDTAFTVRILDTLAEELDINTFEMLSASHAYEYNVSKGPVLEVLFNDILLVDSFKNEPESHGYFKFKIKPKEGFGYGTMIPNEAAIYFDFNDPVITNEAVLTIMKPSSVRDQAEMIDFEVYPNPVRDELRIAISDMDLSKVDEMEIVNQLGIVVKRLPKSRLNNINVSGLPTGVYSIVLKTEGRAIGIRKFLKI
jgi:uncharacterized repeat protein (TIGR01451 family)